jgi:hypothetical protein
MMSQQARMKRACYFIMVAAAAAAVAHADKKSVADAHEQV